MRKLKRYIRLYKYLMTWIFLEKTRGLDFSMRNKKVSITTKGSTGYARTDEKTLKKIFSKIDIKNEDCFIDIGCGKGATLYFASRYPFKKISGLEIEGFVCRIAEKNMQILGLSEKVEIIEENALLFNRYHEYSVYYLFRPFNESIYNQVIQKILATVDNHPRRIYILCHGYSPDKAIMESNSFTLIDNYIDYAKEGSAVYIWKRNPLQN